MHTWRPRDRGSNWFCGRERLYERLLKIINILEVLQRIFLGFSKNSGPDQIENHVPDILAALDSPIIEHRDHHRPELLERVLPNAVEQFRTGHMTHGGAFDLLLLFSGEIERVAQKNIRLPLIT